MDLEGESVFNYARYLASKEPVDERSLNRNVWDAFAKALSAYEPQSDDSPVKILEVGAGIGATFRRIANLPAKQHLTYTLLDLEAVNLDYFKGHANSWMRMIGYVRLSEERLVWKNEAGRVIEVELVLADIHDYLSESNASLWDIVVGQAFLDLFDLETFLPALFRLIAPGGLFYFPINFDGITSFLPSLEPSLDDRVEDVYHSSMDARALKPGVRGRSQSGRHLLSELMKLELHTLEVGSSDWIVYPRQGEYAGDEAYFLQQILQFVKNELSKSNEVSPEEAKYWVRTRLNQLQKRKLIYLAHQIDVFGKLP
ncbi:MAG: hypothetical protein AB8G77_18925 [Rhodothermales bacterium]